MLTRGGSDGLKLWLGLFLRLCNGLHRMLTHGGSDGLKLRLGFFLGLRNCRHGFFRNDTGLGSCFSAANGSRRLKSGPQTERNGQGESEPGAIDGVSEALGRNVGGFA